jgi:O-methyltransferase
MLWRNKTLQRLVGRSGFLPISIQMLSFLELFCLRGHKPKSVVDLIRRTIRERECLLTANEAYLIYSLTSAMSTLPGDVAEVGVYQGGSARLICAAKGDKPLHLFDTFDGLPEPQEFERKVHKAHQFRSNYDSVKDYLGEFQNVYFHRGIFPESGGPVRDRQFCFVHLDVDLYQSTLDGLSFFYPRIVPGGILLSHDYSVLEGVRLAFKDFLADKHENVIELPTTQCMIYRS